MASTPRLPRTLDPEPAAAIPLADLTAIPIAPLSPPMGATAHQVRVRFQHTATLVHRKVQRQPKTVRVLIDGVNAHSGRPGLKLGAGAT